MKKKNVLNKEQEEALEKIAKPFGAALLFILIIGLLCLAAVMGKDDYKRYNKMHGVPKYKVSLLNTAGNTIDTRYAHKMIESLDWGMRKNYKFTYYQFINNNNGGVVYSKTWKWNKNFVKIENK